MLAIHGKYINAIAISSKSKGRYYESCNEATDVSLIEPNLRLYEKRIDSETHVACVILGFILS